MQNRTKSDFSLLCWFSSIPSWRRPGEICEAEIRGSAPELRGYSSRVVNLKEVQVKGRRR